MKGNVSWNHPQKIEYGANMESDSIKQPERI